LSKYSWS